MLSILACYSLYVFFPLWVFSLACESKTTVFAGRPLRLHVGPLTYAFVAALLAIDFATVPLYFPFETGDRLRLCAFDAAVVAVPLVVGAWGRRSIWELWCLAVIAGLCGMLSLPGIAARHHALLP